MNKFEQIQLELRRHPKKWLVTGCAGFIGSNLVEFLLQLDQQVVGLDNLSTGHLHNLEDVRRLVSSSQWRRFRFIHGDICDLITCRDAVCDVDRVLHQAALGSVPRSVDDPLTTNESNVTGFLNMLVSARDAAVESFVYAASSATYGDHPGLPKLEERIGRPLSPYAVTKYVNELYADVFSRCYGFGTTGLRYFNVFGKRQDPDGAYAAVIPKWIDAMLWDREVLIHGDGDTSRDFCFVANAIQANLLAADSGKDTRARIYNVAVGDSTTLNQLFDYLKDLMNANGITVNQAPTYTGFRNGDVRHSQADVQKAVRELGYSPTHHVHAGLEATVSWYVERSGSAISFDEQPDVFAVHQSTYRPEMSGRVDPAAG